MAVVVLVSSSLLPTPSASAEPGPMVAAGSSSTGVGPDAQNSAFGWGDGGTGLGTGLAGDTSLPTPVIPYSGLAGKHITAVSTNIAGTCAIASGQVVCWGENPLPIDQGEATAGLTPTAISVGESHLCAIFSGRAFCWGFDQDGALGSDTPVNESEAAPVPVRTDGVLAGKTVEAISAGRSTTCAIADGGAYCWGYGGQGQLGDGGTVDKYGAYPNSAVPVAVDTSGVLAGKTVTAIGTGGNVSCALAAGQVYCWGYGEQLGNENHTGSSPVPIAVDTSGALNGKTVTDLSVGAGTVCVVAAGKPYCWGANGDGGLGGGPGGTDASDVYSPVAVLATGALAGKNVTDVRVGAGHSCVIASGAVYCWGGNVFGEMGIGTFGGAHFPPEPVEARGALAGRTITDLAVGNRHTMVIAAEPPARVLTPGSYVAVTATRVLDTRPGAIAAQGSTAVQVLGRAGVPASGVSAVVVNLTAVASAAAGYLSLSADGSREPVGSTLNFGARQTVANLAVVPVGRDGNIRLYNGSAKPTPALVDVVGYYLGGTPTTPGSFVPIPTARLLDTRPAGIPGLTAVYPQITGVRGVPGSGTSAISANLAAVSPQVAGSIAIGSVSQGGYILPGVSFGVPQTVVNMVVVATDSSGQAYVGSHPNNGQNTNRTSAILDVNGYFLAGEPYAPGTFSSLAPTAILTSPQGTVVGGGSLPVQVSGVAGVPASGVAAVVVHLTAVASTASGYLAATPDGAPRPTTSVLNFLHLQTVSNLAIVPVGADGKIRLYNGSTSAVRMFAHVTGYYRTGGL